MFLLIGSSVKSSLNKIAFRCLRDMYSFTVKVSLLIGLVYVLWVRLYIHMCKGICIWGSTYPTPNPVIHSLNLKKFKAQKLWNVEISVTLQLYLSIRNAVTCTKRNLCSTSSTSLFSKFPTVHGLYGGNVGLAVPVEEKNLWQLGLANDFTAVRLL